MSFVLCGKLWKFQKICTSLAGALICWVILPGFFGMKAFLFRRIHIHLKFLLIEFHSVNNHRVLFLRLDTLTESIFIEFDLVLFIEFKFLSRFQTDTLVRNNLILEVSLNKFKSPRNFKSGEEPTDPGGFFSGRGICIIFRRIITAKLCITTFGSVRESSSGPTG